MLLVGALIIAAPAAALAQPTAPVIADQGRIAQAERGQLLTLEAQIRRDQAALELAQRRAEFELNQANRTNALIGLGAAFLLFLFGSGLLVYWLANRIVRAPRDPVGPTGLAPPSLATLPLGMPEGSIRALLSIFVIVFGFAIVVLQETLGLRNAEAITGFIGAVIAFYFATRSEAAARESADKAIVAQADAKAATEKADRAIEEAQRVGKEAASGQTELRESVSTMTRAVVAGAGGNQGGSGGGGPADLLRDAQGALENIRRVLAVVAGVKTGAGAFGQARELLAEVEAGLAIATPLLSGQHDAATLLKAAEDAAALAKRILPREPVVSTIVDALSNVTKAVSGSGGGSTVATLGKALLSLGPTGLVGGVIGFGVDLVGDAIKFERLKAALLEQPFDLDLIQVERMDGNAALLVLDFAPAIDGAVTDGNGVRDQLAATLLLRGLGGAGGEAPAPANAVAQQLRASPPEELKPLVARFESDEALAAAIEEYRTAIITVNALGALPPSLPAPTPAGEDRPVEAGILVAAARAARDLPGAADAIDRLVSVIEALGGLAAGERAALLKERFAAAVGLQPALDAAVDEVNAGETAASAAAERELADG